MIEELKPFIPHAIGFGGLGSSWLIFNKIVRKINENKKEDAKGIIKDAREEDKLLKIELEAQIHDLQSQVTNLKANVEKDLEHLRETYNGELRFLGQKIEELRSEVRSQHSQLVQLLTKMIDKS